MRSHFLRARKRSGLVYVGTASATSTNTSPNNLSVGLTALSGGIATSPASGDIILVLASYTQDSEVLNGAFSGVVTSGYTELADLMGTIDGVEGVLLSVNYKISNGTETTVTTYVHDSPAGDYSNVAIVHVWRGVHQTTPIDVTRTTASGSGTGRPNVPSITPVTAGAVILGFGSASSGIGTIDNLTAAGLSYVSANKTNATTTSAAAIIAAYTSWTSGAYDMAQFGGGSIASTGAWAAAAVALRPA